MSIWRKHGVNKSSILQLLLNEKKSNLKNFWLQKREKKQEAEDYDAKIEGIARVVTKYISNRKLKDGSI